jgi:TRAP transporter TAXI family solute receptor
MKPMQLFACFAFALSLAGASRAQVISIITTPAGSFSNSAGSAIAKVVTEKAKIRMTVQAQASTGYEELEAGTSEFNVSNSFDSTFFATSKGEYEGQGPHKNIRHVASLIPYRVAMHVRAGSNIKTISDLKGKRVSSGFNAQKTIARIIEAHLVNGGLTYKDVTGVPTPNVNTQADDFKTNKVDVLFFALGSGAIKEAAASVGGVRVLEVNDSPAAQQRMQTILPGAYVMTVNPSPQFDGIAKATKIIAFDMDLNSSVKVPEDVVYKVVKALYENKADLASTFPPFAILDVKTIAKPIEGIEYHPGAIRFYKEVGLWPPKAQGAASEASNAAEPAKKGPAAAKKK